MFGVVCCVVCGIVGRVVSCELWVVNKEQDEKYPVLKHSNWEFFFFFFLLSFWVWSSRRQAGPAVQHWLLLNNFNKKVSRPPLIALLIALKLKTENWGLRAEGWGEGYLAEEEGLREEGGFTGIPYLLTPYLASSFELRGFPLAVQHPLLSSFPFFFPSKF